MHNSYDGSLESKYMVDEWKEIDDRRRNQVSEMDFRNMRLNENITEAERDLLLKRVLLEDGTMSEAISCYKVQNAWRFTCYPCMVTDIAYNDFMKHAQGRRHAANFSKPFHSRNIFLDRTKEIVNKESSQMGNHTKQPLLETPSSNLPCQIEGKLDDCKQPLIGLEYLLEIWLERSNHNGYYCLLCDDRYKSVSSVIDHLTSQTHRTKYLTKFFPTAAQKLDLYNKYGFRQNDEVFNTLTEHVVARIEHCLGRLKPMQIQQDVFVHHKNTVWNKVEYGEHFQENSQISFVECVDIAHLNPNCCKVGWLGSKWSPLVQRNSGGKIQPLMATVVEPPSVTSKDSRDIQGDDRHYDRKDQGRDLKETDNYRYERRPGSTDRNRSANVDRPRPTKEYQTDTRHSIEPPAVSYNRWEEEERRFYEYTCSSAADTNLWTNYLDRVKLIESNLLEELRFYQETPEKHPKYEEEWKEYWKRRNEELLLIGEDPRNYDISVEWNAFWEIRLNELFKEIFEKEKAQLRQQLQFLQSDTSKAVIKAPWKENLDHKKSEPLKRQLDFNDRSKSDLPEKRQKSSYDRREPSSKQSSNVPVIPVLRKLSVLEHNLGSLGPKVVELLSTALTLEKTTEKGADSILLSEENCVLLETVKEKLKGFLQSGLLQEAMVKVTDAAIQSLIELLNSVPKKDKFSASRDRRSRSQAKKSYSNEKSGFKIQRTHSSERKQVSNKKRSRSTERIPRSTERIPRSTERIPRSTERIPRSTERIPRSTDRRSRSIDRRPQPSERRPQPGERRPQPGERRPRSMDQTPRSVDRRPQPSERRPRSTDRRPQPSEKTPRSNERPRSKDRRPRSNERRPRSKNIRPRSNERKPRSKERKPLSRERQPRSSEIKPGSQEKQFRGNGRNPRTNEQSLLDERRRRSNDNVPYTNECTLHSTERNPQTHQRPVYEAFHNESLEVFISDTRTQPQNFLTSRSLKVSEINVYVEKLGILSQLTFLQRAAISQQIASLLLLRGVTTITEGELLLLIKTLIPGSAQSNIFQGIAQAGNLQFAASSASGRADRGSVRQALMDTPANFVTNQGIYPAYSSQQITKYSNSSAITYPLNTNPYKTGDRRKY